MKKSISKIISGFTLLLAFATVSKAQTFEGVIEFKKQTITDTTSYVYYVKDNQVRIDEIGTKSHKIEGSFIVDTENKTMKSLNHERKLYMDKATPSAPVISGTCEVTKGKEVKNIQGMKCSQYIVKNTTENTQITYWITDGKYAFFEKLLRQLNRKDKSSVYFLQIKDIKNCFPMLSIQTDISGKQTGSLEVTKITKKEVDESLFEIPKGYNKFEK